MTNAPRRCPLANDRRWAGSSVYVTIVAWFIPQLPEQQSRRDQPMMNGFALNIIYCLWCNQCCDTSDTAVVWKSQLYPEFWLLNGLLTILAIWRTWHQVACQVQRKRQNWATSPNKSWSRSSQSYLRKYHGTNSPDQCIVETLHFKRRCKSTKPNP